MLHLCSVVACVLATLALSSRSFASESVTIDFHVTAPLSPDAPVLHLSGDRDEAGNWDGVGITLRRVAPGQFEGRLTLPRGTELQYKITRGSWSTVEKQADGNDIDNRTLTAGADKVESIAVAAWADAFAPPPRSGPRSPAMFTIIVIFIPRSSATIAP